MSTTTRTQPWGPALLERSQQDKLTWCLLRSLLSSGKRPPAHLATIPTKAATATQQLAGANPPPPPRARGAGASEQEGALTGVAQHAQVLEGCVHGGQAAAGRGGQPGVREADRHAKQEAARVLRVAVLVNARHHARGPALGLRSGRTGQAAGHVSVPAPACTTKTWLPGSAPKAGCQRGLRPKL